MGRLRKKDILPNKLSELLSLAIKDIEEIAVTDGYEFNMGIWHDYIIGNGSNCTVCMGGGCNG